MNEPKWKPGDVVVLKTGGPEMTVDGWSSTHPLWVRCVWFDRHPNHVTASNEEWVWGRRYSDEFHQDALVTPTKETANAG